MTGPDLAPEETPTADAILAAMGISARQAEHWVRLKHLRPVDPHPGSGYAREWPEQEIEIGRRMSRLAAAGLPLAFAAEMARDSWPAAEIAPGITVTVTT